MNETITTITSPAAPDQAGVTISPEALVVRDGLFEKLKALPPVTDAESCLVAVDAVRLVKTTLSQVEKDRTAIKAPFLAIGKAIDDCAKKFSTDLKEAVSQVERRIGAYNEKVRREAEEEARRLRDETMRIERERRDAEIRAQEAARKLGEAKTAQERTEALREQLEAEEEIEQRVEEQNQAFVAPAVKTAAGGAHRTAVEVEVTDIHALYKAFPHCVKMEPKISIIKAMAEIGTKLPGVKITEVPVFSVRK